MNAMVLLTLGAFVAIAALVFAATLQWSPTREMYRALFYQLISTRDGYRILRNQGVETADGVRLATDVYLPRHIDEPVATILVRLPYDRRSYGGALQWARRYAPMGYAVVLQDMRGRYGSEGEFSIYAHEAADGAATLDWITEQDWSNGRVGTAGCSALGEVQPILAKMRHPAHRALVAEAAGGAVGTGGETRSVFAVYEGGTPQLAGMLGWFLTSGGRTGDHMTAPAAQPADIIDELPSGALVSRHRGDPTQYDALMANFEDDAYLDRMGFLSGADRFAAPALHVNAWFDPGLPATFDVAALMSRQATTQVARDNQPVLIGPGEHCAHHWAFDSGVIGDLAIDPAGKRDYFAVYDRWFDHWLRDGPAPDLAPFTYYVLGTDRWETAQRWPPANAAPRVFHLAAGEKLVDGPAPAGAVRWTYNPETPTPSLGGPDCCTGQPNLRTGPVDQRPNAARDDVVAFYSDPLPASLTITGDVSATLRVSSDAPDTDLVAILVDVAPDGEMLGVLHGALRLRYRDGFTRPELLPKDQPVRATINIGKIAYRVRAGHRIGLHISSSSFPRLERNLNTGRPNHLETQPAIARNTLYFGEPGASTLTLPIIEGDAHD